VEILERIASGPASPRQIAEATGEPLGRIAYHVAVLHRTSCVRPVDPANAETSDCVYEVSTLFPSSPRISLSDSTRGHALASVLRRIVDHGLTALKAGALGGGNQVASCETVLLDERGWRETLAILEETMERIAEAKASAAARLAHGGDRGSPATVALAAFEMAPDADQIG
jgi:hypothetical protein